MFNICNKSQFENYCTRIIGFIKYDVKFIGKKQINLVTEKIDIFNL